MDRINGAYVVPDLFGAGKDGFKDGNKALGIAATIVNAEWLNFIQEELANVIEGVGMTLDGGDRTQLKQAIRLMFGGADALARFTTTANINLNGLGTQAGGDWGTALTAGDIIFAKNQTTGSQNGWYAAAAGAWARVKWLDESVEVKPAMLTKVSEGVTLADSMWMLTTDSPITLGTTSLAFTRKDGILLADFTGSNQSMGVNGYQKLPGGLIIQWGTTASLTGSGGTATITYGVTFPNANLFSDCMGIGSPTVGNNTNNAIDSKSTSGMTFINRYLSAHVFNWIAIGY